MRIYFDMTIFLRLMFVVLRNTNTEHEKGILFIAHPSNDYNGRKGAKLLAAAIGQGYGGRSCYLEDFAPKCGVVLFVFGKTCCPNNIAMLEELHEIWSEYDKDDMPIKVVLVSLDDSSRLCG